MITETIRSVLETHGKLASDFSEITDDTDLYAAGLTSHATVSVMLSLEDAFEIEFPEDKLTKSTFATIGSLRHTIEEVQAAS
jgi:acyl carrier protein